jgi:PhnB protein
MIMPILAVTNLSSSIDFYTKQLGFDLMVTMPGEDGTDNFAIVNWGQAVMFGLMPQPAPEPRGSGVAFMVYVPNEVDIDAYYAEVQSRGVTIAEEIKDQYWGDRTFNVVDPDGYYLMISKTMQQMSNEEIQAAHAGTAGA